MSKVAVVFWSGTGNTEAMADLVAEAAKAKGADVEVIEVTDFGADQVADFDALAFGCPAMGDEVLEEDEFQPLWDEVLPNLTGKKVGIFGSYSWAEGEWMEKWEAECKEAGLDLVADGVACFEAPDEDEDQDACKSLGEALA